MNNAIAAIGSFIEMHPFITLIIVGCFITAVGQLKSPGKDSSTAYRMTFAVLNFLSLQFGRMFPKVENSPNFQDAVNLQQQLAGQEPTPVKVPPIVEKP